MDRARSTLVNGNVQNAIPKPLTACLLSHPATGPCIAKIAIGKRRKKEGKWLFKNRPALRGGF